MVQLTLKNVAVLLLLSLQVPSLFADRMVEEAKQTELNTQIPKNKSYYMDKVYPAIKPNNEKLKIAVNNYLISVQENKISGSNLGPKIEAFAEAGIRTTTGDLESENQTSRAGLALFQPLLSVGRYYDHILTQQGIRGSNLQVKLNEEQFLVLYAESLLRISESKTRYYFAKEKRGFLENYRAKKAKQLEEEFIAENPGQNFDATKSYPLRTLSSEIERQKRTIAQRKTSFQREINRFRTLVLGASAYPFEKVDNIEESNEVSKQKDYDLSRYNPKVLNETSLPKYILVHPFIERKNIYDNASQSYFAARHNNWSVRLAHDAIKRSEIALAKGEKLWWPEVGLLASFGGNWGTYRSGKEKDFTRTNESFVGIVFTMPLYDGGERKAQAEISKKRLANSKEELEILLNETEAEVYSLHREIKTAVESISSLLVSYKETKRDLDQFLEGDLSKDIVEGEKRLIVDDHYAVAENLALQQHVYLSMTLQLLALRRDLDVEAMRKLEEEYFIDCKNYDSFLQLSEIVL